MFPQNGQLPHDTYPPQPSWAFHPNARQHIQPVFQQYDYPLINLQNQSTAAIQGPGPQHAPPPTSLPSSSGARPDQASAGDDDGTQEDSADSDFVPSPASRRNTKLRSLRVKPKKTARALSSLSVNIPRPSKSKQSQQRKRLSSPLPKVAPAVSTVELKGVVGPLLEVVPGCRLEGNGLLILHPPTLDPGCQKPPISQYNPPPEDDALAVENHRSQFEMYTCRLCRKTYDGKNARSVARRHLQDKHGVPLALQKRRSRWDGEPDRPKDAVEVRERTLQSKRNWAAKNRPSRRLENRHADFLRLFGPPGLEMPSGLRLVAPEYRNPEMTFSNDMVFLDGSAGRVVIPDEILRGAKALEDRLEGSQDLLPEDMIDSPLCKMKGKAKSKSKATISRTTSTSTLRSATSSRILANTTSHAIVSAQTPLSGPHTLHDDRAIDFQMSWAPTQPTQYTPNYQEPYQPFYPAASSYQAAYAMSTYPDPPMSAISIPTNDFARLEMLPDSEMEDEKLVLSSEPDMPGSSPDRVVQLQQRWVHPEELQHLATHFNEAHYPTEDFETENLTNVDAAESQEILYNERIETVAAESLLNLHSTPPREDTEGSATLTEHHSPRPPNEPLSWAANRLLEAPTITTPRPRPHRAVSLIQPFPRNKPEAPTRSLSFTTADTTTLDDPFVFSPVIPSPTTKISRTTKRRSTIALPSPSPLSVPKKRKIIPPSPASREVLGELGWNTQSDDRYTTPFRPDSKRKNTKPTPNRTGERHTSGWMLSSPGNLDTAATLGLAPNFAWVEVTPARKWVAQTPEDEDDK
ncbi:hypothetical protein BCR39DRAFT_562480 [Naematelia encephala]|uniref:Uncharacterized protein n=1 Tax=Naematelia encephala TaxID=71784 RepID=A0A1Y2AHP5_9TREE|nr:hypothetical protein BCR39DRAFT_562480 [Naematelia encephala]